MKDTIISLAEAMMIVEELEDKDDENFEATDIAVRGILCKEAVEFLVDMEYMFTYKENVGMTFISKPKA